MQSRWNVTYYLMCGIQGWKLTIYENCSFYKNDFNIQHWQIASSTMHFKREAHFQCTEMLNHECSCKQMSQHWWVHMHRTYSWIADGYSQEDKKKHFLLLPSLSCAYFTSCSPCSPFTSSHWPLTFFWPSSLACPILPAEPSRPLYVMVGSVFRSESDTGNSWANLQ